MFARTNPAVTPGGRLRHRDDRLDDTANRYSGVGAVGMGFLTGDIDDDDDDDDYFSKPTSNPPGLTPYGRPGPAVVSPNFDNPPTKPDSAKIPDFLRSMTQPRTIPAPIQVSFLQQQPRSQVKAPLPAVPNISQSRPPPTPGQMSPHPLQPPKTPILPAFARPRNKVEPSDVKFTADAILRGNKEETLLARNTPKGAEFWRRFSVVVKEEQKHPGRLFKSSWLTDHQARSFRMNLCIWIVGLVLVALIAGGGVLIWFLTSHNTVTVPKSLGGNAGEGVVNMTSPAPTSTSSTFKLYSIKGDLPPTSTPSVPAGLTMPTIPPATPANPAAIQKRNVKSHKRMIKRLVD